MNTRKIPVKYGHSVQIDNCIIIPTSQDKYVMYVDSVELTIAGNATITKHTPDKQVLSKIMELLEDK